MKRFLAFPILMTISLAPLAAQDLPEAGESFDVEPPLLLLESKPDKTPAPRPGAEELVKDLEKARKNAASAEHLYKAGVLAKVDVEKRALRVIQLQADLANTRLNDARENVAIQQSRFQTGEISRDVLNAAESVVNDLTAAAQIAAADFKRAELDAAITNVGRQKKLLALGSARKSDVARAEEKLAELERDSR